MDFLLSMLRGGLDALQDYILAHTLTCLVPAFFIAGAMSALFPKDKILKYLGEKTKAYISYPISVVAGLFLAVCSCTVLPLFAGIRQRGGGLGPAVAFLYTAPATNILAIIYTGSLIGADLALARIILSVSFASIIGMILTATFKGEEKKILSNVPTPSISQTLTDGGEEGKILPVFGLLPHPRCHPSFRGFISDWLDNKDHHLISSDCSVAGHYYILDAERGY